MAEKSNSMAGFFFIVGCIVIMVVVLIGAVVFGIMDYNEQQDKQDACLKAGGMYIDNRGTDSYCYFNK